MKCFYLFCCLILLSIGTAKGQTLTQNELNPCPGKSVTYSWVGPAAQDLKVEASGSASMSFTSSSDHSTATITVTWQNVVWGTIKVSYHLSTDAQGVYEQFVFTIPVNGLVAGNAAISGLPASEPCDFRGNIPFTVSQANSTSLIVSTTNPGWNVINLGNGNYQLSIGSADAGVVKVVAQNSSCPSLSSATTNVQITRGAPSPFNGGVGSSIFTTGLCDNASATFHVTKYASGVGYTWTADNSNILINGQHSPVTVSGADNTSVTVNQDDVTQSNYQVKLSVLPIMDPALGCGTMQTNNQVADFHVGGNPIVAIPFVTFTASRITITTANIPGALMYAWSMDGNIMGTTTVPRFQFDFTGDCNSHEFQVFITKDCGTAPGVPYDMFICNNGGALAPNTVSPALTDKMSNDLAAGEKAVVMKVFPNPATNKINVTIPAAYLNGFIRVIDVHGIPVKALQANGNNISIDISHLPAGVYVISLEKGTLEKQTTKFVKQ